MANTRLATGSDGAELQHLGVGDTCAAWAAALNPADSSSDPDLALKCAQLLSTLATGTGRPGRVSSCCSRELGVLWSRGSLGCGPVSMRMSCSVSERCNGPHRV